MKIKDITISIFAIIGFVTILSSFNNQTHDTVPESHIWEFYDTGANFALNKVTGEVRKYNGFTPEIGKDGYRGGYNRGFKAGMRRARNN